jgi:hypothetical protein
MMRINTVLSCAVFVILSTYAKAQGLIDISSNWKESFSYSGFGNSTYCLYDRYFEKDTLMDNQSYFVLRENSTCYLSKLLYDSLGQAYYELDTNYSNRRVCYIRESQQKIYRRDFSGNEYRILNFDIKDGDPIDSAQLLHSCQPSAAVKLSTATSVCLGNKTRKRWSVSSSPYPLAFYFIEGVGPSTGFLSPTCRNGCPECSYSLLQYTMQGDTLYKGACAPLGLEKQIAKPIITTFDGRLRIENQEKILSVRVLDLNGRVIANNESIHSNKTEMELDPFTSSILIVEINTYVGIYRQKISWIK